MQRRQTPTGGQGIPSPLYHEIAESIRQAIFYGELQPGDELLPVREMSERWQCAPGTVQRAYRELAKQGFIVSRPGQGTVVSASAPSDRLGPLRRATLANETEAFLLRVLSSGYNPAEVEQAFRLTLDRWRAISQEAPLAPGAERRLRFVGSHDPSMAMIAEQFKLLAPDYTLEIAFAGSLGGLIALSEGKADLAGCHLWDEETDTYNVPFVRRLLPGQRVALVTLAHRRLGLIVQPGNPAGITSLADFARDGVRVVNRQAGAGTRVWLDAQLRRAGIAPERISGYGRQVPTHTDVARAVAEGRADVGLGIQAAAHANGLDFLPLTSERYDLVIPGPIWQLEPTQCLVRWLASPGARAEIAHLGGYEVEATGAVTWVG